MLLQWEYFTFPISYPYAFLINQFIKSNFFNIILDDKAKDFIQKLRDRNRLKTNIIIKGFPNQSSVTVCKKK